MEQGKYLPKKFRDFHNQKDFFKSLPYEKWIEEIKPEFNPNKYDKLNNLSWQDLMVLSIDFVLWHFAKNGCVLKKDDRFINKKEKENDAKNF